MSPSTASPATVSLPDPTATMEVSAVDAHLLLTSPLPPLLIDCREEDEFAYCRLNGATLLPLAAITARIGAFLGSKETPAIIYCHHGMRSMRAVTYLRAHGYSHVFSMRGGINAWSDEVDPSIPVY